MAGQARVDVLGQSIHVGEERCSMLVATNWAETPAISVELAVVCLPLLWAQSAADSAASLAGGNSFFQLSLLLRSLWIFRRDKH